MKTILHVTDVDSRTEGVFEPLTSIDGLASWWTTRVDGDAGPTGVVKFTFAAEFNPSMRVDDYEPSSVVEWRCVDGAAHLAENTFRFELESRDSTTRPRFRQDYATDLSDDDYGTYNYRWGYCLESLKLYCERGEDKPFQAGGPA